LAKLEDQGRITAAAATASRELNTLFNRYRPRNRTIPDEVIGSLRVLDSQLEQELLPFSKVLAAELGDEPETGSQPSLQTPSRRIETNRPPVANNLSEHPAP
jgi:hypothetical protein